MPCECWSGGARGSSKYSWCLDGYVQRLILNNEGNPRRILLHREVCPAAPGLEVDHINRNKLDNRRENLRECTRSQNSMNKGKMVSEKRQFKSKYKGVCRNKGLWRARIYKDAKQISLGYFDTEEEAARAYDNKAYELFGNFAALNFPREVPAWPSPHTTNV